MLVVEQVVDRPVEVEQLAGTQVVDTLVVVALAASFVAVAGQQSVRSAAHPYIAALLISYLHDGPLHRQRHLLQPLSRVAFFFETYLSCLPSDLVGHSNGTNTL